MSFDDITLTPLPDEKVENGDFRNQLTGWETWTGYGSTFVFDEALGCFTANIPTRLLNQWSAQLYQDLNLTAVGKYRIPFCVKSSVARQARIVLKKRECSAARPDGVGQ